MVSYLNTEDNVLEVFISSSNKYINHLFSALSVHNKTNASLSLFKSDIFHSETIVS